jgi:hypothetical protein
MLQTLSFIASLQSILATTLAASPAASAPQSSAAGADDAMLPSVEELIGQAEVFLVSEQRKKDCPRTGSVCLFGHGGGTVAGVDVDPTVGIVTTLARGAQVAGEAARGMSAPQDWHVEMIARFKSNSSSEPIIVAVLDYADPEGMARKEATAVWQVDGPPVKALGLRMLLSSEEGFRSHHTYVVRVVQGTGKAERLLAESNFLLE